MIRLSFCFTLLTVIFYGYAQTTQIMPIPVSRMPDLPQGHVTFMYEELNIYLENPDVNTNSTKLLNSMISRDFVNTAKPYIVVFSSQHTQAMVEEQTEKLLKKWDFENNYPYDYLLILSDFSPKLVFGKHILSNAITSNVIYATIEPLWKSNQATTYTKLSAIIKNLKNLNISADMSHSEDYLSKWDKVYFFNYSKNVSEKQERYLNKLLEETYRKENIRFWIISGTSSKNKDILAELLQKADFNTHTNQVIIAINSDIFGLSIILTKDLQANWSTAAENQVKQTAEFYYDKGWYYDAIKESFLMTKQELFYKNTSVRYQEEQLRLNDLVKQTKNYNTTIRLHKMLFWIIAIILIFPLLWAKKYIQNRFSKEPVKKLNDMKLVLGIGYAILLIITGISIVMYTPLFYVETSVSKVITSTLTWMLIYLSVLLILFNTKAIEHSRSVKTLFICTTILYFFSVPANYFFFFQDEMILNNTSSGRDLMNVILVIVLGVFIVNKVDKKQRFDTAVNTMAYSYKQGTESIRKGFGNREYVSKYIPK